jgi:ribonuclease G
MLDADIEMVTVNNVEIAEQLSVLLKNLNREHTEVRIHRHSTDIFNTYNIRGQIERILKRKVILKNGAYLIFDSSEALNVVDVNTGKYVGDVNLEETVFKTNLIAAEEIARQIRLRNISGIIIIDFIDMTEPKHRERVLEVLGNALKKDRMKATVAGITNLGLVEVTRKKTRAGIAGIMLKECPYCRGDSYVYSNENMIMKIREGLIRLFNGLHPKAVAVTVNPDIFETLFLTRLLDHDCKTIWQYKPIYIIPDRNIHTQDYKLEALFEDVLDLPDNARLLY